MLKYKREDFPHFFPQSLCSSPELSFRKISPPVLRISKRLQNEALDTTISRTPQWGVYQCTQSQTHWKCQERARHQGCFQADLFHWAGQVLFSPHLEAGMLAMGLPDMEGSTPFLRNCHGNFPPLGFCLFSPCMCYSARSHIVPILCNVKSLAKKLINKFKNATDKQKNKKRSHLADGGCSGS